MACTTGLKNLLKEGLTLIPWTGKMSVSSTGQLSTTESALSGELLCGFQLT